MKQLHTYHISFFALAFLLFSCTVDNVEDENNNPKTDFSSYSYVLATEDAATADITRFFSFNLSEVNLEVSYDLFDEYTQFIISDSSTSSLLYYFIYFFIMFA